MLIDSGVVTSSLSVSGSYNQTGNAVITGSLTVTGGITGSITSASYAFNADLLDDLDSTAFLYTSSFNAFSSSYSGRISNSEVTASALTAASSSLSIRVSNTEATSSVLTSASGSFSTRVTNTEATASSLTTASGSFSTRVTGLETASGSFSTRTTNLETTSSNLVNASGSFSTRVTNTEATASSLVTASGSFSTRVTNTEATASNLVPRVVNLEATASNLTTASGSFSTRVTGLESASGSFSTRMTNEEATGSRLNTASASFALVSSSYSPMSGSTSTRLTGLESASGSFSTRVTNTEATASNLVPRVVLLETTASNFVLTSGSVSSRVTNLEVTASSLTTRTTNLENASGSFSTRVTNAESSITSLTNASGSFSTRVTNEEATGSRLVTASGSFSTRVTTNETNISSLQTASGSASTRLTNLESASGSFSTRVTTLESASGSTSTRLTSLETASGSFSNRVTNTEATASNLVPRVTLLETTASNFVLTSGSVSSRVTNLEVTASSLTSITNNLTAASGSFSTRTTNLESTASVLTNASASFVNMSSSLSIRVTNAEASVTSLNAKTGSYATTGSNTFTGTQTVQGTIIAQTLNVQQVTSSIVYSSGSNTFGKLVTDVQSMTGSLRVTGSGEHWVMGGSIGVGTTSPAVKLHVTADGNNLPLRLVSSGFSGVEYHNTNGTSKLYIGTEDGGGGARYNSIDNKHTFYNNGNAVVTINSSGCVGINTTSPVGKFEIKSSAQNYVTSPAITFTDNAGVSDSRWILGNIATTYGAFNLAVAESATSTTYTPVITVLSGSNYVGIGTTLPASKLTIIDNNPPTSEQVLTIKGTGAYGVSIHMSGSSNYRIISTGASSTPGGGVLGIFDDASTYAFLIKGSKLFNFNSTTFRSWGGSATALQVAGYGVIYNDGFGNLLMANNSYYNGSNNIYSNNGYATRYYQELSAGSHYFQVASSGTAGGTVTYNTALYIDSSKAVGVNTTTTSWASGGTTYAPLFNVDAGTGNIAYFKTTAVGSAGITIFSPNYFLSLDSGSVRVSDFTVSGNSLRISSANHLLLTPSGNVGVGTTNPLYALDVIGRGRFVGSSGTPAIQITEGSTSFGVLGISGSQAGDVNWLLMSGYPSAGDFTIRQSDVVNAITIKKTTGYVGIGTTNPDNSSLRVKGDHQSGYSILSVQPVTGDTTTIGLYDVTGSRRALFYRSPGFIALETNDEPLYLATAGSNRVSIDVNGNVGIGTTTPLAIAGTKTLTIYDTAEPRLQFLNSTGGTTSTDGASIATNGLDFYINNRENGSILFYNNGSERARINQYNQLLINATGSTYGSLLYGYNLGVRGNTSQAFISIAKSNQTLDDQGLIVGLDSSYAYFYARDNIGIQLGTNNSAKVTVSSGGSVGIGTTSPVTLLDVRGEISVAYNATYGLRFYNDVRNNWSFIGNSISGSSSANLRFGDATGEVIRITGGNVGIGTTSPSYQLHISRSASGNPLYVEGGSSGWVIFKRSGKELYLNANYSDANQTAQITPASAANMGLSLSSRETEADLYITGSTGYIGIGTTTPKSNLHIYRSGQPPESNSLYGNVILDTDSTSNYQRIRYDVGTTPYWGLTRIGTSNNFAISGRIGSTWSDGVFVIQQSSGNIGIGTTSPTTNLQVYQTGTSGNNYVEGTIQVGGTSSTLGAALSYAAQNSGYVNLVNLNTSGGANARISLGFGAISSGLPASTVMTLNQSGNVGIGTTAPDAKLAVHGQFRIRTTDGDGNESRLFFNPGGAGDPAQLYLYNEAQTNTIYVTANGASYFNGGSVGIGTTSPGSKLTINGDNNTIYAYTTAADGQPGLVITNGATLGASTNINYFKTYNSAATTLFGQNVLNWLFIGTEGADNNGILLGTTNAKPVILGTSNTERMKITSGGNFDYGGYNVMSSANSVYRQAFWGAMSILWRNAEDAYINSNHTYSSTNTNVASYTSANGIGRLGMAGGILEFGTYDGSVSAGSAYSLSTKLIVTRAGNVGIGTTSAPVKLIVAGTIRANGADGQIDADSSVGAFRFYNGSTFRGGFGTDEWGTGGSASNLITYINGGNYFIYSTSTSSKIFTALSGGNIGINTTTPKAKLQVKGSVSSELKYDGRDSGLVLYYPFSENTSTTAVDRSQTGANGTLTNGPTWSDGLFGYSVLLDGSNDYISVAAPDSSVSMGNTMTYAMWIYPTNTGAQRNYLFDPRGDGNTSSGFDSYFLFDRVNSSTVNFTTGNGGSEVISSNVAMGTNQWYHVAATRSGSTWRIYLNGVEIKNGTTNTSTYTWSGVFRIGTYSGAGAGPEYYFKGNIDQARMYNRTLSANELMTLYLEGVGTTAPYTNASGNVGIGTTSPTTKLHLYDANRVDILFHREGFGKHYIRKDGDYLRIRGNDDSTVIAEFLDNANNNTVNFPNGKVGIGTTGPTSPLHVVGTNGGADPYAHIRINATGTYPNNIAGLAFDNSGVQQHIRFLKNGSEKFQMRYNEGGTETNKFNFYSFITSTDFITFDANTGNIGINDTTPSYTLDVAGTIRATGDVIAYSDARVKDNVTTVENALDKVKSLRGVTYTRKDDDTKTPKVGVIAQEVLPILPEVVQQDTNGNYSVAYGNMVGVLIEAIKEQQRQIDELKYLLQNK